MQVDPDQREWFYKEEQERLRWKRKLQHPPRTRPQWILAVIAVLILAVVIAVIASSGMLSEILARLRP